MIRQPPPWPRERHQEEIYLKYHPTAGQNADDDDVAHRQRILPTVDVYGPTVDESNPSSMNPAHCRRVRPTVDESNPTSTNPARRRRIQPNNGGRVRTFHLPSDPPLS